MTAPLEQGLVGSLEASELARAPAVVMGAHTDEIGRTSPELLGRLERVLSEVIETARA